MSAKPKPVFLLAGGRDTARNAYADVVKRIYKLTGSGRPRIAYIGAANDDNPRFIGFMSGMLAAAGPCDFELAPLAGKKGSAAKARKVVEAADLVFVGGGDVEAGMKWIRERDFARCLEDKRASGAPVFGASAGAIMLASRWVRWRDPDDDSTAELFDCLGLAPVLCDTHCEEDDWVELKAALGLAGEGAHGWGIRSGAAIEVGHDGSVKVTAGKVDAFAMRGGKVCTA
jgi:peptidase E